jgi:benzoate membrane transport protein
MTVGFGNWPSWLREWSQSLGVGLAMVTLASSLIAVPLSAAGQLNLADGQVTAWVMTIYTVPCVLGIVLTLHFRQPLLLTGNIFVLIFIVSLQGRVPFAELAGASLVAGAAVVAISALGLADHLARLIPEPVVVGLLAGSTLPFVAGVFTGMGSEPAVVGAAFLAYILGRKYLESRVPPIFLALAVGIGAAAVLGKFGSAAAGVGPSLPLLTVPVFTWSAILTATLVAFAVAVSDVSLLGLGPYFWSLLFGVAVSWILERDGIRELRLRIKTEPSPGAPRFDPRNGQRLE